MENSNNIKIHQIDNICIDIETFKDYFLNHNYNENMFNPDGTLNRNYNSFKKTGLIAQIFEAVCSTIYSILNDTYKSKKKNKKKKKKKKRHCNVIIISC